MMINRFLIYLALLPAVLYSQSQVFIKFNEVIPIKSLENTQNQLQLLKFNLDNPIYPKVIKELYPNYIKNNIDLNHIFVFSFNNKVESDNFLALNANNPNVMYAKKSNVYKVDALNSNDSLFTEQWALKKIRAEHAWSITKGSPQLIMAIIDTGVDFLHPDLENKIAINDAEDLNHNGKLDIADLNNIDDDGNGFIDDVVGWDFTDRVGFPIDSLGGDYLNWDNYPMDEFFHGTFVAGIAGAELNNNIGIAGVAPNCKILPIRAFDPNGFGEEDDVAAGILYAVQMGAKVINMSFGDDKFSNVLKDVISYAHSQGVVLIASSGNSGNDLPHYPSGYSEVISVGNSNQSDFVSQQSSFGSTLDLVAPGTSIISTDLNGGYRIASGTSASAPHVTGAAALILSQNNFTNEEVKQILKSTSDDIENAGWDIRSGAGRLNVERALQIAAPSNISIDFPLEDFTTNKDTLPISATILSANFVSFNLYYGVGITPSEWTKLLSNITYQFAQKSIFNIDISSLKDTAYTIRLEVNLNNNRTTEERVNFYIDRTPPKIELGSIAPIFYGKKSTIFAEIFTSDRSIVKMFYRKRGEANFNFVSLDGFATNNFFVKQYHYGFIPKNLIEQNTAYDIYFEAINLAGLSTTLMNNNSYFILKTDDYFQAITPVELPFSLPLGNLFKNPVNFTNRSNKSEVLFEPFADTNSTTYSLMKLVGNSFENINTINGKIPISTGDFNNNGKLDLLSNFIRNGFIDEQTQPDNFSLTNLYENKTGKFFPILAEDINNDGNTEIITNSNNEKYYIWRATNSGNIITQNSLIDSLENVSEPDISNSFSNQVFINLTIADCNNDGKNEIWFADADGDLIVYQINSPNNIALLDTIHSDFTTTHSQTISKGDFDGDGVDDIAILFKANSIAPYFVLRVFNYKQNKFNVIFEKVFLDQSSEFSSPFFTKVYQSLRFVNTTNSPQDELVINIFPYLYIFDFNNGTPKIIFYKEGINSQSIFQGDLNNNGKTEIAFQNKTGYKFYEFENTENDVPTPEITAAFSTDSGSTFLKWNFTSERSYIFRGENKQNLRMIDSSVSTTFADNNVNNLTNYYYAIQNFSSSNTNLFSSLSSIVEVFVHPKTKIDTVFSVSQKDVIVKFTDKMENTIDNVGAFEVEGVGYPKSVSANSEYSFLLSYESSFLANRNYVLDIKNLTDIFNSPLENESRNFIVSEVDSSVRFYVSSFSIVNNYSVEIEFNLNVDSSSAVKEANYIFTPANNVGKVTFNAASKNKVILHTKNPIGSIGKQYSLKISNLFSSNKDGNIKINTGAGSVIVLTANAENLNDVYVFPNPVTLNSMNEQKVTFANITKKAEVQIFSISGKKIIFIESNNNSGGVIWDLRDFNGKDIESGIYIYRVISKTQNGEDMQSVIGKFAVIR